MTKANARVITTKNHAIDTLGIDLGEQIALYVIGDAHGDDQALQRLIVDMGREDVGGLPKILVLLGDLTDRGNQGLRCLKLAGYAQNLGFERVIYLPGNHELILLGALDDMLAGQWETDAGLWFANKGYRFFQEILGDDWNLNFDPEALKQTAHRIIDALPTINGIPFQKALRDAPSHARFGNVLLVHGGVDVDNLDKTLTQPQNAHIDYTKQRANKTHWAWMREAFLGHDRIAVDNGKDLIVVHGHTTLDAMRHNRMDILDDPDQMTNIAVNFLAKRICLDFGAGKSNGMTGGLRITPTQWRIYAGDQKPVYLP